MENLYENLSICDTEEAPDYLLLFSKALIIDCFSAGQSWALVFQQSKMPICAKRENDKLNNHVS